MSLTDHENEILKDLQRQLAEDDPALAGALSFPAVRPRRRAVPTALGPSGSARSGMTPASSAAWSVALSVAWVLAVAVVFVTMTLRVAPAIMLGLMAVEAFACFAAVPLSRRLRRRRSRAVPRR